MKIKSALLLAISLLGSIAYSQTPTPTYLLDFGRVVGKNGSVNADGSYRINIPRTDVKFISSSGMPIPPDLGLTTYIALSGTEENSLAVGDIALLQTEIDPVIDRLRAGGIQVVALHNHMTTEEPRLFYMHFQATGKANHIANAFRSALDVLGSTKPSVAPAKATKPTLDTNALAAIFGAVPQKFPSGVLRFSQPRKDVHVTVEELPFTPAMGLASWAAFAACECGQTMVMGDTCCLPADLQDAIDAYRKAGIHIAAIHNHTLNASHQVIFMHYEAEGDSIAIAHGIKACWEELERKR
ncbi:MAG: DUF1259 domain-containing protein [Armatimonadetes bacterium]|nr:DUF1259 domain-containing protein [Armatimonadota bacterium]